MEEKSQFCVLYIATKKSNKNCIKNYQKKKTHYKAMGFGLQ